MDKTSARSKRKRNRNRKIKMNKDAETSVEQQHEDAKETFGNDQSTCIEKSQQEPTNLAEEVKKVTKIPVISVTLKVQHNIVKDEIKSLLSKVKPDWKLDCVRFTFSHHGAVNQLVQCSHSGEDIIVRINGNRPFVKDYYEASVLEILAEEKLCMPVYARFLNGLVFKYAQGRTLSFHEIRNPKIMKIICSKMQHLHSLNSLPQQPEDDHHYVFPLLKFEFEEGFLPKAVKGSTEFQYLQSMLGVKNCEEVLAHIKTAKCELEDIIARYPTIFCHFDLHRSNIIYDKSSDSITFIDWEHARYGPLPFELLKLVCPWTGKFDEQYAQYWVKLYLSSEGEDLSCIDDKQLLKDVYKTTMAMKMLHAFIFIARDFPNTNAKTAKLFFKGALGMRKDMEAFEKRVEKGIDKSTYEGIIPREEREKSAIKAEEKRKQFNLPPDDFPSHQSFGQRGRGRSRGRGGHFAGNMGQGDHRASRGRQHCSNFPVYNPGYDQGYLDPYYGPTRGQGDWQHTAYNPQYQQHQFQPRGHHPPRPLQAHNSGPHFPAHYQERGVYGYQDQEVARYGGRAPSGKGNYYSGTYGQYRSAQMDSQMPCYSHGHNFYY